MTILTWILLYGLIIFLEVPNYIKQKKRRELTIYSIFIGLSFTLSILIASGVKIPSIDGYIGEIIKSITEG